jgi:hypothetical protein
MKKFMLFATLVAFFGFSFVSCASKKEQVAESSAEVADEEVTEGSSAPVAVEATADNAK